MNYLSHHTLARNVLPDAPPAFYVGNAMPDLLSTSGDGRLRAPQSLLVTPDIDLALVRGIRLHLTTDRRFHGNPAFAAAMGRASEALRAAPFTAPLRRVFFIAHAFVEIAIDGNLIGQNPALPDDFYAQFHRSNLPRIIEETGLLIGAEGPLVGLAHTVDRIVKAEYLYSYAQAEGLADAMGRVARRAGLPDAFDSPQDLEVLAECFAAFVPSLTEDIPALLSPPEAALWYNSGEIS